MAKMRVPLVIFYGIFSLFVGFVYGNLILERMTALVLLGAFIIHYFQIIYPPYTSRTKYHWIIYIIGGISGLVNLIKPVQDLSPVAIQFSEFLCLLCFRIGVKNRTYEAIILEGFAFGALYETLDEYCNLNQTLHFTDYAITVAWIIITAIRLFLKRKNLKKW